MMEDRECASASMDSGIAVPVSRDYRFYCADLVPAELRIRVASGKRF
jgi:hypothetical protein